MSRLIIIYSLFLFICLADGNDPHFFNLISNLSISSKNITYRPADIVLMFWNNGKTNFDWWKTLSYENGTNWFYVKENFPIYITNNIGTNFKFVTFKEYEKFIKHK